MNNGPLEFLPLARTNGIVTKEVDGEVLVYDRERDKAHCLNLAAGVLWRLCDGKTSPLDLAKSLERQTGARVNENVIWLGLEHLRRNHLLEESVAWPEQMITAKRMSRREAVARIGVGAAIAVPIVMSITAPTAAQAGQSCNGRCRPCKTNADCCSGVCSSPTTGCGGGSKCS